MKRANLILASLILALGAAGTARADTIIYAVGSKDDSTSSSVFGTLDLNTGAFTQTATLATQIQALTQGPDGSIVGAGADGHLYTIDPVAGTETQLGTATAPLNGGSTQYGEYGLVYSSSTGFFAVNENGGNGNIDALDQWSSDGNTVSTVKTFSSSENKNAFNGSLAYGPDGTLYLSGASSTSGGYSLSSINPTTYAVTLIGDFGFDNHPLSIVTVGGTLYGIDQAYGSPSSNLLIHTIDTTIGESSRPGTQVTGLPSGDYFDAGVAIPASVPEPASILMTTGGLALAGLIARRRRTRG